MVFLLRFHEEHSAFLLLRFHEFFFFSFFSLFCQPYLRLRNRKSIFLILQISQYGRSRRWVQSFAKYWIAKYLQSIKNWYKYWYIHFYATYGHQIWDAVASIGSDLNESNQAGASDASTSISCDKLKALYLPYQSVYGHQTWQGGNLPWWAPAHKGKWPFDLVIL